jgi:hypothetical protein
VLSLSPASTVPGVRIDFQSYASLGEAAYCQSLQVCQPGRPGIQNLGEELRQARARHGFLDDTSSPAERARIERLGLGWKAQRSWQIRESTAATLTTQHEFLSASSMLWMTMTSGSPWSRTVAGTRHHGDMRLLHLVMGARRPNPGHDCLLTLFVGRP